MTRTTPCTPSIRAGRLAKARQFHDAATLIAEMVEDEHDLADAYVTLAAHAGIAAADVICCARLGRHARGDNHADAVNLLARADAALAGDLKVLLAMKTFAGYSDRTSTIASRRRASRASSHIVTAALDEP